MTQRVVDRLIDKVYSKGYGSFVNDDDAIAVDYASEVRDKKAFYDMCKVAQRPQV